MPGKHRTESQWQEMIAAYLSGQSMTAAAAIHGANGGLLGRQLRKRGMPSRGIKGQRYRATVDETRFSVVDDEAGAYWLGVMYTDGYVLKVKASGQWRFGLELAALDRDHVLKFAAFLKYTGKVTEKPSYGRGGPRVCVLVSSPPVCESLIRLGCTERKTWTLKPWDGPEHLMPHFWRGCLDGDGCLHYSTTRGCRSSNVAFVGTEEMVRALSAFVEARTGKPGCVWSKPAQGKRSSAEGRRSFFVNWGGNVSCREVVSIFYGDATVYLDRKMEKAREMMAYQDVRAPNCQLTAEELREMIRTDGNLFRAGKRLRISYSVLHRRAKKLLVI